MDVVNLNTNSFLWLEKVKRHPGHTADAIFSPL